MKIMTAALCFLSTSLLAFSCYDPQPIIQKPIQFDEHRIKLTREYQLDHYGIASKSIEIEPKMIVLHYTSIPTFKTTYKALYPPTFSESTFKRPELPGNLNVSSHFLVDRDGTIYQLMPENWMARHVIGLNHFAIGIENVGGVNDKQDLTHEQAKANAFLICYLKKKYPAIDKVIGHMDYLQYKRTPLWLEKNSNYRTEKKDPGLKFMHEVLHLISNSHFSNQKK